MRRRIAFNAIYAMLVTCIGFGCMFVVVGLIYLIQINIDTGKFYLAIGGAIFGSGVLVLYMYFRALRALRIEQQHESMIPVVVVMGIPVHLPRRAGVPVAEPARDPMPLYCAV